MPFSLTPTHNLKAVLKETGLAADTLRAWERRYGLPTPQRTAGGHRLYSQHDIETIKWLIQRQAGGLSISHAVDMWNEQIASGLDPLADSASSIFAIPEPYSAFDSTLDSFRVQWIQACLNFDEAKAEQALNQSFSLFPVEAVCVNILQKGMSEIGTLWYENDASVQQEHFASGLAMRRLDALLSATPVPTQNKAVIVGCPAEEWHTFTPLLLSLLLRRRGLRVLYLGANVPADRFAETVKDANASLVVLVAQQLISAATLQETALQLTNKKIPVAFGGRIFNIHPTLKDSIPGQFLGTDLDTALNEIDSILASNIKSKDAIAASAAYTAAHHAFQSKLAQIELTLKEHINAASLSPDNIRTGIDFLGQNITAALQLGNMSYVSTEVDWLKTMLQAHKSPPQQLIHFMETYSNAVDKNINGQGQPIFEWLASEVQKLKA